MTTQKNEQQTEYETLSVLEALPGKDIFDFINWSRDHFAQFAVLPGTFLYQDKYDNETELAEPAVWRLHELLGHTDWIATHRSTPPDPQLTIEKLAEKRRNMATSHDIAREKYGRYSEQERSAFEAYTEAHVAMETAIAASYN